MFNATCKIQIKSHKLFSPSNPINFKILVMETMICVKCEFFIAKLFTKVSKFNLFYFIEMELSQAVHCKIRITLINEIFIHL